LRLRRSLGGRVSRRPKGALLSRSGLHPRRPEGWCRERLPVRNKPKHQNTKTQKNQKAFRPRFACRASSFWQTIQKEPKNLAPKAQPASPVPCTRLTALRKGFIAARNRPYCVAYAAQSGRRSLNSLRSDTRSLESALPSAARLHLFKGAKASNGHTIAALGKWRHKPNHQANQRTNEPTNQRTNEPTDLWVGHVRLALRVPCVTRISREAPNSLALRHAEPLFPANAALLGCVYGDLHWGRLRVLVRSRARSKANQTTNEPTPDLAFLALSSRPSAGSAVP